VNNETIFPYDNLEHYWDGDSKGQGCIYFLSSDGEEEPKHLLDKDGHPFKETIKSRIGFV